MQKRRCAAGIVRAFITLLLYEPYKRMLVRLLVVAVVSIRGIQACSILSFMYEGSFVELRALYAVHSRMGIHVGDRCMVCGWRG